MGDLTNLFEQIRAREPGADERLLPLVYEELKRLAKAKMARERPGQTIQATALVHEAYLRLLGSGEGQVWDGRGHFFAAAAEAMRRILVDAARRKKRIRHGGGFCRVELSEGLASVSATDDEILALDEALSALEGQDPLSAGVVRLRYFAGLTHEQVGQELGISQRTSERRWDYARAWLRRHMRQGEATSEVDEIGLLERNPASA